MKVLRVLMITLLSLIFIAAGTLLALAFHLNSSPDELSENLVIFQVDKGASFNSIAEDLEESGLIRSSLFLKIYNRVTGSGILIKTGSYNIESKLTSLEIINRLEEGRQKLLSVVIPEGMTARRIGDIFEVAGVTDSKAFIEAVEEGSYLNQYGINADSLEGFLFPDTYSFQLDFPAEKVVRYMVDIFFKKLEKVYPDYRMLTSEQIYEKIILSSIIEKEYRVSEEAPKMASVFYNRIDRGMPLESCATIIFVLTEQQMKAHPDRILFSDLEIKSEFNTYRNTGLPPAPISNPGVVALNAVFNPAQTDYLFFVVDDIAEGTHIFSKNYGDHLQARADYINNFRSK